MVKVSASVMTYAPFSRFACCIREVSGKVTNFSFKVFCGSFFNFFYTFRRSALWFITNGATLIFIIAETLLSKNSDSNKTSLEYTVVFVQSVAKLFFKVFCLSQTKKCDYQSITWQQPNCQVKGPKWSKVESHEKYVSISWPMPIIFL